MIKLIGMIAIYTLGMFLAAVAGADIWNWFVAPLGVPAITKWHALGLLIVARFFTFKPELFLALWDEYETVPWERKASVSIAHPLVVWGIGALIHWAMT